VALVNQGDPFADVSGAPIEPDDDHGGHRGLIDWRVAVLLIVLAYVLVLAWTNFGTSVTIQIPPFIDAEIGLVWLVLVTLAIGSAVTLVVQAAYRGYRRQHEALENAARADLALDVKPGRTEKG
jgi:hypothetical protein